MAKYLLILLTTSMIFMKSYAINYITNDNPPSKQLALNNSYAYGVTPIVNVTISNTTDKDVNIEYEYSNHTNTIKKEGWHLAQIGFNQFPTKPEDAKYMIPKRKTLNIPIFAYGSSTYSLKSCTLKGPSNNGHGGNINISFKVDGEESEFKELLYFSGKAICGEHVIGDSHSWGSFPPEVKLKFNEKINFPMKVGTYKITKEESDSSENRLHLSIS